MISNRVMWIFLILCEQLSSIAAQLPFPDQEGMSQLERDAAGISPEQLCQPDASIPDDLIKCGSCQKRCGTKTNPGDLKSPEPGNLCACDKFCGFHGDCCEDFEKLCPKEFHDFHTVSEQYPSKHTYDDFECRSFSSGTMDENNMMVHTCASDGSECGFIPTLNEDVNTFVPMYDIHRGVHYISNRCAVCNGATNVIPWGVTLHCGQIYGEHVGHRKDYLDTGIINSTESLIDIKETGDCSLQYRISGEPRPCFPLNVISTCEPGCHNQQLVSLCESGSVAYTIMHFDVYKNAYCALCNGDQGLATSELSCGFSNMFEGNWRPEIASLDTFSLTLVFDFDPRRGLTVGEHPPPECSTGEVYVPDEDDCRQIMCSSVFGMGGSDCAPNGFNITVIVTGTFSLQPPNKTIEILHKDKLHLERSIQEMINNSLDSFGVIYEELHVETDMDYDNEKLKVYNTIECDCDYRALFQITNNNTYEIRHFEESVVSVVRRAVIKYLLQQHLHLKNVRTYLKSQLNNSLVLETEQMSCIWLVYKPNETLSGNGTITVVSTGRTYPSEMYEVLDNAVIVCETRLGAPRKEIKIIDMVLSILTLVCIGISIFCLVIRVILQHYIASFNTKPGRIQLQMTIALLIAFIMLVIGPLLSDVPAACTTAAVLLAYGFLAAFIWMNVIALDTWLVFRPASAFLRSDEGEQSLTVYLAVGWGIPLFIVTVSIGMNYADVSENFKSDLGGSRCWYTQRYAMLLYFGVPVALSILLNIFLYLHTSINLHQAFHNALTAVKADAYHFSIYVRLFILMGITWIFGFISAFTDQIVIDFIFVILTSLQGLFLFISFVCNKQVLLEVKKTVKSETSSTNDKRTKSTRLPSHETNSERETNF